MDRHVVDVTSTRPDPHINVLHQTGEDVLHLVVRPTTGVCTVWELPRIREEYEPNERVDLREDDWEQQSQDQHLEVARDGVQNVH